MKATAPSALSERPVDEKSLLEWVNRELIPLARQLRQAVNFETGERKTATTGGAGAYARVWTSEALPTDGTWLCIADVSAVTTSGTFQAAGYVLAATFRSSSGTVAQVGATSTLHSAESVAAIDARFGVDAANRQVYLEARDDAATAMTVTAVVRTLEARR